MSLINDNIRRTTLQKMEAVQKGQMLTKTTNFMVDNSIMRKTTVTKKKQKPAQYWENDSKLRTTSVIGKQHHPMGKFMENEILTKPTILQTNAIIWKRQCHTEKRPCYRKLASIQKRQRPIKATYKTTEWWKKRHDRIHCRISKTKIRSSNLMLNSLVPQHTCIHKYK